jgi:Holliday junction resolvasome RuvABC DNA-binding subunit
MVATLRGKVAEEALLQDEGFGVIAAPEVEESTSELREDGIQILVNLGYRRAEAASKVDAALKRNQSLQTPEDLIREVYRGERASA